MEYWVWVHEFVVLSQLLVLGPVEVVAANDDKILEPIGAVIHTKAMEQVPLWFHLREHGSKQGSFGSIYL